MTWTWLDLVFFSGSVYGLAWLVTRSKLFAPVRGLLRPVPFLGHLVQCVVCTSVWVALCAAVALPRCSLL